MVRLWNPSSPCSHCVVLYPAPWVACVCVRLRACVLQGRYFYLTPGVCPSLSTMKSILESAGGKLLAKQPSYRKIIEHKQNKVKPFTLQCQWAVCPSVSDFYRILAFRYKYYCKLNKCL